MGHNEVHDRSLALKRRWSRLGSVALSFGDPTKLTPYVEALRAVGLEPVLNPESLDGVAGLVLAGGTDVSPELYGQVKQPQTQDPDVQRDQRELKLIREAVDRDLPLFAICRGLQMLNVALGGTLVQDLPNASDHMRRTPDPSERIHDVIVAGSSLLSDLIGSGARPVNSRHHQAIADVARDLRVTATSPGDNVVEAAEVSGRRFAIGVQWHPEDRIRCEADRRLFESFADAVSRT